MSQDGARPLRVALARVLQLIGWAGLVGSLLLVIAALLAADAWSARQRLARQALALGAVPLDPAPVADVRSAPAPVRKLPGSGAISLLLNRIERAAVGNDLPWATGDYRLVAPTEQWPASVEVRCALKGPYPKLRAMVADLLAIAPAVTFKEMIFSRQAVTSADVEAKFVIVIFLAEEASTPATVAEGGTR